MSWWQETALQMHPDSDKTGNIALRNHKTGTQRSGWLGDNGGESDLLCSPAAISFRVNFTAAAYS